MSAGPQSGDPGPRPGAGTVLDDEAPELSRTYAEALLGASEATGGAEAVLGELDELIEDVWRGQPAFARILASASVPQADKDRMLVEVFEGRALPVVVNFLRVLNRHGRLGLLPSVVRQARAAWDRRMNRVPVRVRTAVPLDEGQQQALRETLGRLTGGTPVMSLEVDPALLGGLVVQVGDDLYDGSLRTRLRTMRRRLVEEKRHEIQRHRDLFAGLA